MSGTPPNPRFSFANNKCSFLVQYLPSNLEHLFNVPLPTCFPILTMSDIPSINDAFFLPTSTTAHSKARG